MVAQKNIVVVAVNEKRQSKREHCAFRTTTIKKKDLHTRKYNIEIEELGVNGDNYNNNNINKRRHSYALQLSSITVADENIIMTTKISLIPVIKNNFILYWASFV